MHTEKNKTWYDRLKDSAARTFYPNTKYEYGWDVIDMEYLAKTIPVWSFIKVTDYNVPLLFAQLLIIAINCYNSIVDLGPSWVPWFFWLIRYSLSMLSTLFALPTVFKLSC